MATEEGESLPSADCQSPLSQILEVSRLGAEGRKFSSVIFPEEFSLIESPLRGVPALNVRIVGVRHGAILSIPSIERWRGEETHKDISSDVSADVGDRKMDTYLMNGDDLITGSKFGVESVRVTLRDSR